MAQIRVVKTICNLCASRCGIDVYVDNGRIVKVTGMQESPFNMLCVKAQGIPELAHSKERLTTPLRKINGVFKEVSWDEAVGFAADKLTGLKQKHGARSLLVHLGVPFIYSQTEYMARRFCDLFGTPNYTTGASFCFLARVIGHSLTCGSYLSAHYPGGPKCMIIWGQNPTESRLLQADFVHALLGRGSKLIVIDPRATPLAKKADIHGQIRPGTDCALALGMLNVIIEEELYDKQFVERWTVGFEELARHVRDYPPEKVETITWIKAETIREMARMYAENSPAAISPGISLDHSTNGIQAIRAITTLIAITGNIDVPGGNTYGPGFRMKSLRVPERPLDGPPVGTEYPIFTKYTQEQSVVPAIDQLLTGKPYPIKALLITGCNPALTWPNSRKFLRCRENLDLLVVMEIFMTDTAEMADLVLPGTSFLETENFRTYPSDMSRGGLPLIAKSNRVIDPVGDSMEDWRIWAELGIKMGYADSFPWKDNEELFEFLLEGTNVSLEQLKQNPGGVYYGGRSHHKYVAEGFNTPSGKVEIYSKALEEHNYDPLPTFHEPSESPVSRKDIADRYPYMFISGPRTIAYHHSQCRNLSVLRKLLPEPLLEINPRTALQFDIKDGDFVKVESLRGSVKVKARLTSDVLPATVVMQHGWREANANLLTNDEERDPISGYPGFRSVMCRVSKAS
ncbi:MAG: molybdopterin-dependent oxidoreductase [Thermodesulfobacteriota bacterium]